MIRSIAVAALVLTSASASAQGDPVASRFPAHRFAISAPGEGWIVGDGAKTKDGFRVDARLNASGGLVASFVLTGLNTGGASAALARDGAVKALEARAEYREHTLLEEIELSGQVAAGVDVLWETDASGAFRIRMHYVVADGRTYLIQAHAPAGEWDAHADALGRFTRSFQLIEPLEGERGTLAVAALAARCGSEVELAGDWAEAARLASETGRHVLVVLRSYPGFDIPDTTRLVTFMDEDVIALLRSRTVAVRLDASSPSPLRDPEVYGLSPSTFGVAFLLVDADGNVLADTPHAEPEVFHRWLVVQLARHPGGQEVERPSEPIEQATLALDRGELDDAARILARMGSLGAHRLRARLCRLQLDAPGALEELEAARALDGDFDHALACDLAELLFAENRDEEARSALAPVLADDSLREFPEALLQLSFIEQRAGRVESGRAMRDRLMDEFPESRWAWLAAAYVELEPILEMAGADLESRPPRREVFDLMIEPDPKPIARSSARRAEADAVAWLLSHQREDGSWPSPTELKRKNEDAPDHIATAVDALAARALLQRGARYRRAAERGLAFLVEADGRRRADPKPVVYMDYTAWSTWAQLDLIADAMDAGLGDDAELRAWGARLVADLASRVRRNGGWSYYISGDAAGGNTVEQSISFTTAAAVIGLVRARDAGITVPEALIEGALDCLEAMRGDDGLFAYMIRHPGGVQTRNAAPGAAGRGPACELALRTGGRTGESRVLGALELFEANAGALAAEVGKALMHAGADSQGCHYPFFDYMMAARAAESLGERARARHRAKMLDLVLEARLADGSFQDTPITGPTFGTAAALLTMHALKR